MNSHRGSHGQATVEFGISAIVLLLLLLGLVDLGRVFYFAVGFRGATREGARQASWFDPATGTNPTLADGAIKSAVDAILRKSGLASTLANPGATCPTPADGNSSHNPPYVDATYAAASVNQPLLYICYSNTPGLDLASPPGDNSYGGTDVNVILVMSFGLASGFMQGLLGNSLHVVANTHMTVGGY
jgi:Flp pilus assembly protein TadG